MSRNPPDYSDAFIMAESELANDDLEKARQRLRRRKSPMESNSTGNLKNADAETDQSTSLVVKGTATIRKPITLKVQAENEAKFHLLFSLLQVQGDTRRKQDLADEALNLLFLKYQSLLCSMQIVSA